MGKNTEISIFTMFTPLSWAKKGKFWKNEKKPPTQVPIVSKNIENRNQKTFRARILNPEVWVKPWAQKDKFWKK